MPLKPGKSKRVMDQNFHEFRHGKTFARTKRKFGADKARKQMIAAVMSEARKNG
jgi:hypothetical protein